MVALTVARPPVRITGVAVCDSDRETATPKLTVSVSGVAGALTWCVAPPPSDHDANAYVWPPSGCGVCALTVMFDPTMTVCVSGVGPDAVP